MTMGWAAFITIGIGTVLSGLGKAPWGEVKPLLDAAAVRIVRLAATRHSDVYLDEETIPETISRVLRNDGAAHAITGLDVDIRTTGTGYRKRSFVYRHEESCLAFISRHLEHEGMYYYFRQDLPHPRQEVDLV